MREQASAEERSAIGKLVVDTKCEEGLPFEVGEVNVMRSTLTPSGAIYNRLASIELEG